MTRMVKFEELKPGMLTTEGLIYKAKPDDGLLSGLMVSSICVSSAYHGMGHWGASPDHEFEIIAEVGSEEYRKIVAGMTQDRIEAANHAGNDILFMMGCIRSEPIKEEGHVDIQSKDG